MNNQTGFDVWERMLGDEGDQLEEDCYNHGDEDASRDPRSVETGSHAKQRNSMHITYTLSRSTSGRLRWLDKSKKEIQRRDET